MTGENSSALTFIERKTEHVKALFQPVFRALHADLRHHPGGPTAVAEDLDQNPTVFCDKFNPGNERVPTCRDLLEVLERVDAHRTVAAMAHLANMTAISLPLSQSAPQEIIPAFLLLVQECGHLLAEAAEGLEDGRLDAQERERVAVLLDRLLPVAVQMRALVRS